MSSGINFALGYTGRVRYEWNTDYNTLEVFSETGEWLGLSSAPQLSLNELKALDEDLATGILDLTQFEDSSAADDLNGMPSGDLVAAADSASSENGINGMNNNEDSHTYTHSEDGSFLAAPPNTSVPEFRLLPAPNSRAGRNQEGDGENGQTKSAEAATLVESDQSLSSPLTPLDSSSPSSGNNNEADNTLERSSRDLVRPAEESHENKLTRKRNLGAVIDVESQQHDSKRKCTIDHANAVNGATSCPENQNDLFLMHANANTSTGPDANGSISTQYATQYATDVRAPTSFHLSAAALQKLMATTTDVPPESPLEDPESPFEIPEAWLYDWIGPQNNTPQAFGDTLTIPTLEERLNFRPVWVTHEDMMTYGWTVCRSLSTACHLERARNLQRNIVDSICKGYKKWRKNGGIEELRQRYEQKTPDDLLLEAQIERLIMEHDPIVDFAPGPDDPLPSIEDADGDDGILAPHDQPADAYRGWDKQWYNISDIDH